MKTKNIYNNLVIGTKILTLLAVICGFMSCIKDVETNLPVSSTSTNTILNLGYISAPKVNKYSGLSSFASASLTFPLTDEADTALFIVSLTGQALSQDLTVTIKPDFSRFNDNFKNDSIPYVNMPDSLYSLLDPTVVIKAGETLAEVRVKFYPSKIDPLKNFILPITATTTDKVTISGNYGIIYFHTIGNPIAGAYNWDFLRYNTQDGSGSLNAASFTGEAAVFAPASPTSIKVPTGYYVQPNYLITFSNKNGVLSDFKAVIAPDEIKAAFTDNGLTVVSGPTITVNADYTKFTINYAVFNGSAYRNLTDIYYK